MNAATRLTAAMETARFIGQIQMVAVVAAYASVTGPSNPLCRVMASPCHYAKLAV